MQTRILSVVEVIDILLLGWLLCWSKYSVGDGDVGYDDKGFRDLYGWHRTLLMCLWVSLFLVHVMLLMRTSPSRPKLKQRPRPTNLFKPMFGDKTPRHSGYKQDEDSQLVGAPWGPGATSPLPIHFPIFYSVFCILLFTILNRSIYFLTCPSLPLLPECVHSVSRPEVVGGDRTWV